MNRITSRHVLSLTQVNVGDAPLPVSAGSPVLPKDGREAVLWKLRGEKVEKPKPGHRIGEEKPVRLGDLAVQVVFQIGMKTHHQGFLFVPETKKWCCWVF